MFEREEGKEHLTDKRFDIVTAEGQEVSCLEGTHRTGLSAFRHWAGWLFVCTLCSGSASLANIELLVQCVP